MQIFSNNKNDLTIEAVNLLENAGHTFTDQKDHAEVLISAIYEDLSAAALSNFPQLKYILITSVGTDTIDMPYCQQKGITVFNAPGSNADSVAELGIALAIMLLRFIPQHIRSLQTGNWRALGMNGSLLKSKVIGLVGFGVIGQSLAHRLNAFSPEKILAFDPFLQQDRMQEMKIEKTELDNLLGEADIVFLQVPLNMTTTRMINLDKLKIMKPTGLIINLARGEVINESDLITALRERIIAGAAVDVFAHEPNVNPELLKLENLIATPHIGGFSSEAKSAMSLLPVNNFLEQLKQSKL